LARDDRGGNQIGGAFQRGVRSARGDDFQGFVSRAERVGAESYWVFGVDLNSQKRFHVSQNVAAALVAVNQMHDRNQFRQTLAVDEVGPLLAPETVALKNRKPRVDHFDDVLGRDVAVVPILASIEPSKREFHSGAEFE
jgi:hypothetical protein